MARSCLCCNFAAWPLIISTISRTAIHCPLSLPCLSVKAAIYMAPFELCRARSTPRWPNHRQSIVLHIMFRNGGAGGSLVRYLELITWFYGMPSSSYHAIGGSMGRSSPIQALVRCMVGAAEDRYGTDPFTNIVLPSVLFWCSSCGCFITANPVAQKDFVNAGGSLPLWPFAWYPCPKSMVSSTGPDVYGLFPPLTSDLGQDHGRCKGLGYAAGGADHQVHGKDFGKLQPVLAFVSNRCSGVISALLRHAVSTTM